MKTSYYLNEKGCPSYSINQMDNNEDMGLVALDSQIIGKRGSDASKGGKGGFKGGKGGFKGGKGGTGEINTKCDTCDANLYNLFNNITNNINIINNNEKKKQYMGYLLKLIYKIRDIHEGNGERDIF